MEPLDYYRELLEKRRQLFDSTAPLQKELDIQNAQIQVLYQSSMELARQINDARIQGNLISLDKEIASLARTLGRANGVLATHG